MGVEAYSTVADDNTAQMPEGQAPSTVNNGTRTIQAHTATWYNDPGWYRPGAPARTITRVSGTVFREPGVNVTTLYHAGRRVRATGTITGTIYGEIASASFTGGNTDVTVDWDSSSLAADSDLLVYLSIAPGLSSAQWIPHASDDHRGMTEYATDAEALALTADNKAITPANLGALDASTTQAGIVELATTTETRNGVNSTKAVTAQGLSANASDTDDDANPIHRRYPGGIIEHAGSGTVNGSGVATITFTHNYTNEAFPVVTARNASFACAWVTAKSLTDFSIKIADAAGVAIASCPFDFYVSGT